MPRLYLNSYAPLCGNKPGRHAADAFDLPPFIDASIRREPDLEHAWPSISCLCRAGKFAPRLRVRDVVVYITRKGRHGIPAQHWRLTAILRVVRVLDDHPAAAEWYRDRGLPLPSNCLVVGNDPKPLSQSHRGDEACGADEQSLVDHWDSQYRQRCAANGTFVVCAALWRDLDWTAPVVTRARMERVFGRVPGTRNPGAHPIERLDDLVREFDLAIADPALPAEAPDGAPSVRFRRLEPIADSATCGPVAGCTPTVRPIAGCGDTPRPTSPPCVPAPRSNRTRKGCG